MTKMTSNRLYMIGVFYKSRDDKKFVLSITRKWLPFVFMSFKIQVAI